MKTRVLAVAIWAVVTALLAVVQAEACVGCRFELICDKFGEDCQYAEFCAALKAPQGGASYCTFDDLGFCYEVGICQVAQLRPWLDSKEGNQRWSLIRGAGRYCPDWLG
jgi:hypothetical protein